MWGDGGAQLWTEGDTGVLFPLVGSGSNALEYGGVIKTQTFLGKVDFLGCVQSPGEIFGENFKWSLPTLLTYLPLARISPTLSLQKSYWMGRNE